MADDQLTTYTLRIRAQMDKTLRDALSEVAQVGRQLQKEARDIQKSLQNVGSEGINVDAVQRDVRALSAEIRRLRTPVAESDRVAAEASRSMDRWRQEIKALEQEIADLPGKINLVNQQLTRLRAAGDTSSATFQAYNAELRRLTDYQNRLNASNRGSTNSFRNIRQQAQNAAFQITDFGVSLQNGTRASVAFTQQAPQLLAAFGPIGVGLSLLAVAVGIFASKWIDSLQQTLDASAKAKQATKEFDEALKQLNQTTKNISLDAYTQELERLTSAQAEFSSARLDATLDAAADANKKVIEGLLENMRSTVDTLANEYRTYTDKLFGREANMGQLILGLNLSKDAAQALENTLAGVNPRENLDLLLKSLDKNSEAYKQLLPLITQYNDALESQEELELRKAEAADLAIAKSISQEAYYRKLGQIRGRQAAEELIAQDKIKAAQDDYIKNYGEALGLTEAQLKKLLGIKDTTEKVKDLTKDWVRQYEALDKQTDTSAEKRRRELAEIDKLQANLLAAKKEGKIDIEIDLAKLDRARKAVNETFKKEQLEEYLASLTQVEKLFYDLEKQSEQTQQNLAALDQVRAEGTIEQYEALVKLLGDAAPLSDRLNVAMRQITSDEVKMAELNEEIKKFAEEMGLSEEQVKKLKKAMNFEEEKQQLSLLDEAVRLVKDQAISGLTDSFIEMAKTGEASFDEMVNGILESLARLYLNRLFQQIVDGLPGISSTAGASAAAGTTRAASVSPLSRATPQPTFIPLSSGSSTGSSGFSASPARFNENVTVNVVNNSGAEATVTERQGSGGRTVDVLIENAVESAISRGRFDKSLGGIYGLRRRGM